MAVGQCLLRAGKAIEEQVPLCQEGLELLQAPKLQRVRQDRDFRRMVEWGIARERDRVGLGPQLVAGDLSNRDVREWRPIARLEARVVQDSRGDPAALSEQANVLEVLFKASLQLVRQQLPNVVRVSSGIRRPVRRGDGDDAPGTQNAGEFTKHYVMLCDVLDHLKRDDRVERCILERQLANVTDLKVNLGRLATARCVDDALLDVDAHHLCRAQLGEDRRPVAGSAARIEYASALHQEPDPPVPPTMLGIDELASHDVGNEPLGDAIDKACEVDLHR